MRKFFRSILPALTVSVVPVIASAGMSTVIPSTQPTPADKLVAAAEKSVKAHPEMPDPYRQLASAFMDKARECADGAYYLRAEAACDKALTLDKSDYETLRLFGWIYDGEHRFAEGATAARKAMALKPDDPWNYGTLGDAEMELGQYDEAEKTIQTMADLRPDVVVFPRVAYFRELIGDMDGAIEMMQKATSDVSPREPEHDAWCHAQLGNLLLNTGNPDKAAAEYETALQFFSNHYLSLAGLARANAARGHYDEAIQLYNRSLQMVPLMETAVSLADLLTYLKRPAEAAQAFALIDVIEKINESNKFPPEYQIVGFYADHDISLPLAVRYGEQQAHDRQDVRTMDALAWAYYKSGRLQDALASINKALRLGSKDASFHFHAGMIDAALGDGPRAEAELKAALTLNPYFHPAHAEEAKAELAHLQAIPTTQAKK